MYRELVHYIEQNELLDKDNIKDLKKLSGSKELIEELEKYINEPRDFKYDTFYRNRIEKEMTKYLIDFKESMILDLGKILINVNELLKENFNPKEYYIMKTPQILEPIKKFSIPIKDSEFIGHTEIRRPDRKKNGLLVNSTIGPVKYTMHHGRIRPMVKINDLPEYKISYSPIGQNHPLIKNDSNYYSCGFCSSNSVETWIPRFLSCLVELNIRYKYDPNRHQLWSLLNHFCDCVFRFFCNKVLINIGRKKKLSRKEIELREMLTTYLETSQSAIFFEIEGIENLHSLNKLKPDHKDPLVFKIIDRIYDF